MQLWLTVDCKIIQNKIPGSGDRWTLNHANVIIMLESHQTFYKEFTTSVKSNCCISLRWPVLQYGSTVCSPHAVLDTSTWKSSTVPLALWLMISLITPIWLSYLRIYCGPYLRCFLKLIMFNKINAWSYWILTLLTLFVWGYRLLHFPELIYFGFTRF